VDYTAAFVQAELNEGEQVYVEMPRGFRQAGHVLQLRRALYGLKQSPRTWFDHLKLKLETVGFKQSNSDACLFYKDGVVCLVYVDDCLFFAPDNDCIDAVLHDLENVGLDFNIEDDVAGFLGVLIARDKKGGTVELTQTGLTDRIVKALGLEGARAKKTPAEHGALPKDADGEPRNETWSYPSVVGMMLYLSANSRPDITFAVNQCCRYSADPKHSHEIALKRVGRYLLGTRDRGLILDPTADLNIEMYVDADFAGLWGREDPKDPVCVRSRTGFIICIAKCPVLWVSKLQTETALSTMMAEYIALSMATRDLIPFKRLAIEVGDLMGLNDSRLATIKAKTVIHEDNNGALTLANMEPGRNTPTSKFFHIKYHWFREQMKPNEIRVVKVDTQEQLADIFTKGLRLATFEPLRLKIMGW
jgi:hypothetical protein